MKHTAENLLELFNREITEIEKPNTRRIIRGAGGLIGYRIQKITAGKQIELKIFPIWDTVPVIAGEPQNRKSPEAIARANATNAKRHFARKMDANFTDADYRLDTTYHDDYLPEDREAQRDVRNFLRRIQYACRKRGLPPPKYMGVSEGKREGSRQVRVHHHIVISCGLSRDELEALWGKGRVRSDRLQADRFGYAALANYLMKDPQGAKRYFCSRNLKEPTVTIADTKLSMRRVEEIARDMEENAPVIFGKLYKDCEYLDCTVKRSDFVSGIYIYARLRKIDDQYAGRRWNAIKTNCLHGRVPGRNSRPYDDIHYRSTVAGAGIRHNR